MTTVTIRTVGNRSLYRDRLDSETHHHTIGGVMRRMRQITSDAKRWSRSMGDWGHVEITINGETWDEFDTMSLIPIDNSEDEMWSACRNWERALNSPGQTEAHRPLDHPSA